MAHTTNLRSSTSARLRAISNVKRAGNWNLISCCSFNGHHIERSLLLLLPLVRTLRTRTCQNMIRRKLFVVKQSKHTRAFRSMAHNKERERKQELAQGDQHKLSRARWLSKSKMELLARCSFKCKFKCNFHLSASARSMAERIGALLMPARHQTLLANRISGSGESG